MSDQKSIGKKPIQNITAIAVTGLSCRFPDIDSPKEFYEMLLSLLCEFIDDL